MMMKNRIKQRKINIKKLKTTVLFMIAFILCISVGLKVMAANFGENQNRPAYVEVMVKSGDSLWMLTKTYYQGNEDIRKIIFRIKEINKLESAEIFPGQLIKIPQG
jgi:LysM repeat protein